MKKATFMTFVITLAALVANAQNQVTAGERVALIAKPAVVKILDGYVGKASWQAGSFSKEFNLSHGGSGSGAFVDSNGFIVTNAHVVSATKEGDDKATRALFSQYAAAVAREYRISVEQLTENDWAALKNQFIRSFKYRHIHDVVLQSGDRFPFQILNYSSPDDGKDVAIIKIEVKDMPMIKLGDSDKVRLQEHVTVLGYPGAGDSVLLDEKSSLQPSITNGTVSARKNLANGVEVIQIDAPATHGNSGGPVVNDKGEIVGLLTFGGDRVYGQEVQGFNFIITSSSVSELMTQAGVKNEGGSNDRNYREGLDLYFGGRYSSALAKFETLRSEKAYVDAVSLIKECEARKGEERHYVPALIVAGIAVVALGGGMALLSFGIILLIRIRSKRKKKARTLDPQPQYAFGL